MFDFIIKFSFVGAWLCSSGMGLSQTLQEWEKQGDQWDTAGKPKQAIEAYEKAMALAPSEVSIVLKIAKQYGDLMPSLKGDAKKKAAEQSLAFSRKALSIDPQASDSYLAVAISLGKLTEFMSNKEKLVASREMKEKAERALQLNPNSDYAHHLLGRWHQEMAGIGSAIRLLAKVVYGGIPEGSYEEALQHFKTARKLMPKRLIHQVEYGRTLAKMGNKTQARIEIEKGLAMPNREADDADAKIRGRKSLKDL